MKIERIDDKTVKCYLSNEELANYEIDYKDFVTRSEKAKEVVQEIIEQAQEEVGYHPPKFAFDLQIMMVPDQGLVLTFSDRDAEVVGGPQMMECLKEMKKLLENTKEQFREAKERADNKQESQKSVPEEKAAESSKPDYAVFGFESLHDVMNYVAGLPGNLRVDSKLYELEGAYYLYLQKGHASYQRFSRACIQAMEYGVLYTASENRMVQLEEHGTCLIAEKAIRKLQG